MNKNTYQFLIPSFLIYIASAKNISARGFTRHSSVTFEEIFSFLLILAVIVTIFLIYFSLKETLLGTIFDILLTLIISAVFIYGGVRIAWFGLQFVEESGFGGVLFMSLGIFISFRTIKFVIETFGP